MTKNVVICCDGTNNSLIEPLTNIAYLHQLSCIEGREGEQWSYYDAGVGVGEDTEGSKDAKRRTRLRGRISLWAGSAFGVGLVQNVEQAYLQLIRKVEADDRIFLFGFSRGAYTVRVIAGLMQNYGLLKPDFEKDVSRVVKAFQALYSNGSFNRASDVPDEAQRRRFAEAQEIREHRSRTIPVHFVGLFDTVSSLGWAWDPKTFANTQTMPNVRTIRHALAIDERRAKFRTNRIQKVLKCDHQEIWFPGVHSDVGGGYGASKNALSRVALRWMLREAMAAGMLVNPVARAAHNLEANLLEDEQAEQHESLSGFWKALEYVPLPHWVKRDSGWVEERRTYRCKGWREIRDTLDAHVSLERRMQRVKNVHWDASRHLMRFWP